MKSEGQINVVVYFYNKMLSKWYDPPPKITSDEAELRFIGTST